jgi:hypothetical protein
MLIHGALTAPACAGAFQIGSKLATMKASMQQRALERKGTVSSAGRPAIAGRSDVVAPAQGAAGGCSLAAEHVRSRMSQCDQGHLHLFALLRLTPSLGCTLGWIPCASPGKEQL